MSRDRHRPAPAGRPRVPRPDGGRHRPALPPAVPPHRRGARGGEMLSADARLWDTREVAPPARPLGRARSRASCRSRAATRDDGRRGAPQRRTRARRSSTSTWAARPRRSATRTRARRCCATKPLVAAILEATVRAVDVPVTLKIRTGWDPRARNGVRVARIAEAAGIRGAGGARPHARLPLRGRSRIRDDRRDQAGGAHPGDRERRHRLGRARPLRVMARDRRGRRDDRPRGAGPRRGSSAKSRRRSRESPLPAEPCRRGQCVISCSLTCAICTISTAQRPGVRIARKHIGWYCRERPQAQAFRQSVMQVDSAERPARTGARVLRRAAGRPHAAAA